MADSNTFDAIVIGSGITGGWAAKELTEKGLKTLVLERGRNVEHVKDYPTMMKAPWEFKYRGLDTREVKNNYPIQCTNYAFSEATQHFYVNDKENPYTTPDDQPFRWIRGYQVGGRSLLWGRQSYRWSDYEFESNLKDGVGVDWPIRYKDLEPWYDYVEQFVGVNGRKANIPQLPDGKFLPPMEMNCVEKKVKETVEKQWPGRFMTESRSANLTKPIHGRGACQYRSLCERGCPYGATFTSNSSTLPAAMATGNLTLRPHSIVHSIIYDEAKDKVTGVRVIDANTNETVEYYARVIFLCASTLNSTLILMNSATPRYSNGLANSSGVLGHYLMDHHKNVGATGTYEGFENVTSFGFRPNSVVIPRFRNINEKHPDFTRGYGVWGSAGRGSVDAGVTDFSTAKNAATQYGPWSMRLYAYGECLPNYENKVEVNTNLKDKWDLPTLKISTRYGENELAMRKDMITQSEEMLDAAGFKNVNGYEEENIFGFSVHEMGTARMGRDPKTSVLNGHNQCHDIPNLFITDGSCMTSSSWQNPSLTYMALTARAVDYAVSEMKKNNL